MLIFDGNLPKHNKTEYERIEKEIKEFVGSNREKLFFHREPTNCAYYGSFLRSKKRALISSVCEGGEIENVMENMVSLGCSTTYVPVDKNGIVKDLGNYLTEDSLIFGISWANRFTGVIQPIWDIGKECKKKGVLFYVNGTGLFSGIFFRLQDLDIDFLSFEDNKGVRGLFVKEGVDFHNMYSSYNEDVLDMVDMLIDFESLTEMAYVRNFFENAVQKEIPGLVFFGREKNRLPDRSCFSVPGLHGDMLSNALYNEGILVGYDPSLETFLKNTGASSLESKGGISVCFEKTTTLQDVEKLIYKLVGLVKAKTKTIPSGIGVCNLYKEENQLSKGKESELLFADSGSVFEDDYIELFVVVQNGKISDVKYKCFGKSELFVALDNLSKKILGKSCKQCSRMGKHFVADRRVLKVLWECVNKYSKKEEKEVYSTPLEFVEGESRTEEWESGSNDKRKILLHSVVSVEISPYVELDGGSVEILKVEKNNIFLKYNGNCTGCPSALTTTLGGIKKILRSRLHPRIEVNISM